jgi:UDP-glucose 4-epimerase
MNILVTGGAGFIGSHLVRAYLRAGHRVVVVDDLSFGKRSRVPPEAAFEQLDIRDPGLKDVFERHRIDFVNHHAARADVRDSIKHPELYLDVNVRGGLNLLELCRRAGIKGFIFPSSGGCSYGEPQYVPTDEGHPLTPMDPYGASKVAFELYLQTYAQLYGIPFTIFRYPNVYGAGQDPFGESAVTGIFAGRMLRDLDVTIFGDGQQVRDFVYIDDVVRANMMATEHAASRAYNLGWGAGVSVNTIFRTVAGITGYAKRPIYAPHRLGEISRSVLTSARIRTDWGWEPRVTLDDGLRRTVDYVRAFDLPTLGQPRQVAPPA